MKGLLSLLLFCLCAVAWSSGIYRWVDDQGNVHFSDSPSEAHASESLKLKINTFESVTYDSLSVELPPSEKRHRVVMYSATWCGVCTKARRYFEANNIGFTEYDVETSQTGKAGFEKLNGKGVPIILVGDKRMNGFSAAIFETLYQKPSSHR
ncbi:MAG: glutaredoxin family protein [Alcanivoracaceae bacterium]|nr:glutaredoxin family protein [Alcanivoracaceae bacterium]MED5431631.1 DUF4124 domain-containing protein [Pseudomonadota bacterium]|tara:strand:- start:10533 stop:10988 length:456 start_codon:yes stop_codon:yes gene_type:complete